MFKKVKLIALQPIEAEENNYKKALKNNHIYPLYDNYKFSNDNDESIIDLQNKEGGSKYFEVSSIESKDNSAKNLYPHYINISAVVGKNGSGKSSLLELYYRYLYNISVEHELIVPDPNAIPIQTKQSLFQNLDLNLFFEIDNEFYSVQHRTKHDIECKNEVFKLPKTKECIKKEKQKDILFCTYSIVVNYSVYGLNSLVTGDWLDGIFHKNDGYQTPIVINPYRDEGNIDINTEYLLAQSRLILNHYVIGNNQSIIEDIILEKINFSLDLYKHQVQKNENKTLQDEKEKGGNLTTHLIKGIRSSMYMNNSLDATVEEKEDDNIKAKLEIKDFEELIYTIFQEIGDLNPDQIDGKFITEIITSILRDELIEYTPRELGVKELQYICILYIFKKIRRITENYKSYKHYSSLFDKKNKFPKIIQKRELFESYLNELKIDTSHITFKLKQAINYFKKEPFLNNTTFFDTLKVTVSKGSVAKITTSYFKELTSAKSFLINELIIKVPLALIEPEIMVYKENGKEGIFNFNELSSGEQQMIHTILGINYHIFNLESVVMTESNLKYKCINLVFDEIELYFHPEFQRKFIKILIENLTRLHTNVEPENKFHFNVIFSTHSPFILSDIPSQNTLKLDNGKVISNDKFNSFGANIHDLLADEFFLENGSMGAYSMERIEIAINLLNYKTLYKNLNGLKKELGILQNQLKSIDKKAKEQIEFKIKITETQMQSHETYLIEADYWKKNYDNNKDTQTQMEYIETIISTVGEPVIKHTLSEMYNAAFNKSYENKKEIEDKIKKLINDHSIDISNLS